MAQQVDIPGLGIVEFPTGMSDDDIANAIKKNIMPTLPATSKSGSVGRTVAGFADTILGAPGAIANEIGYAGARALGRSPEQAQAAKIFETQPVAKAFGVGASPEYQREATQRFASFVGENISKGSKWISDQTGMPQSDVENMINTIAAGAGVKTAPLANKAIGVTGGAVESGVRATGRGAKAVAQAPGNAAQGVINALKSDTPQSSLKLSETTLATARDPKASPTGKPGVGKVGELAIRLGDNEIPMEGRVIENMAETAARGYKDIITGRGNRGAGGLQGIADVAGLFGIGVPFQGSLIRAGVPAAIQGLGPMRAVDPASMKGMTIGGKPTTFDIFTARQGIPFVNRKDFANYIQPAGPENTGRRTYGREMDEMPEFYGAGPKPVVESITPAAEPIAKSFGQAQLDALRAKLQQNKPVDEAGPGKREQNAAIKESKQMLVDTTISDVARGDIDAFQKHNIPTTPVDVTDMSNATKGYYRMIKEKVGGAMDEIPDTTWLNEHGLTEQAYIQRVWKEVIKRR